MKGAVSFHPLDLALFDDLIAPLVAGKKVNPESFLADAARLRQNGWQARRFAVALRDLTVAAEAPKADPAGNLWQRLRSNLERMDFKPDEVARRAAAAFDPDLHLDGRPFLIGENSAERVTAAVDAFTAAGGPEAVERIVREQLARLDAGLRDEVMPADLPDLSSDLAYRGDLLAELKKIHDLGRLARDGSVWAPPDRPARPAREALADELPWRAVAIHARARPFWIALDVDGLETICRAAGVPAPDCLSPAWRPFAEACDAFPELKEALGLELRGAVGVGAFVLPQEIGQLVDFLAMHGAKIISAAARAGEGPMATSLLRKIKECAAYAQKHGFGYLEAGGIWPPEREATG